MHFGIYNAKFSRIWEKIMRENEYQAHLISEIKRRLPECEILKNDPNYIQGILDLTIFFKNRWAMLEVKMNRNAKKRPNQEHYVRRFHSMSYAAFIWPEIEEKILNEMEQSLRS